MGVALLCNTNQQKPQFSKNSTGVCTVWGCDKLALNEILKYKI